MAKYLISLAMNGQISNIQISGVGVVPQQPIDIQYLCFVFSFRYLRFSNTFVFGYFANPQYLIPNVPGCLMPPRFMNSSAG